MVKRFRGRKAASLLALSLAAAMVITPSANALAAPLVVPPASTSTALNRAGAVKDQATLNKMYLMIYSEAYYAEKNPDLVKYYNDNPSVAARFGSMSAWLKWHYLTYGVNEDRDISPIIDINAYRKGNPDLAKAFGDKRVEYLKHFVTYGLYENVDGQRTNAGFKINVVLYLQSYADLAKAYGTDYLAACQHYAQYGRVEGRTKGTSADPRSGITLSNTNTSSSSSSSSNNGGGGGNGSGGSGGGSGSGGNSGGGSSSGSGGGGTAYDKTDFPDLGTPGANLTDTAMGTPATAVTVSGIVAATPTESNGAIVVTLEDKATEVEQALTNKIAGTGVTAATEGEVLAVELDVKAASNGSTVKDVTVTIPEAVVEKLVEKDSNTNPVAVIVKTDVGNFTVPVEAFEGASGNVTLEVKKLDETTAPKTEVDGVEKLVDSKGFVVDPTNAVILDVNLIDSSGDISVGGLTDKIQVSIATSSFSENAKVNVYFVNGDNKLESIGKPVTVQASGKIEFSVNHLTEFVIAAGAHKEGTLGAAAHTFDMFSGDACMYCNVTLTQFQTACTGDDHKTTAYLANGDYGFCPTCGKKQEHKHTDVAKVDATGHWTGCEAEGCNNGESSKTAHSYTNGACTVGTGCTFTVTLATCPNAEDHVAEVACGTCGGTAEATAPTAAPKSGEATLAEVNVDINNVSKTTALQIDAKAGEVAETTGIQVTLTKDAVARLADDNDKDVTINGAFGTIVIPAATIDAAKTAGGEDKDVVLTIKTSKTGDLTCTTGETLNTDAVRINVDMKSNSTEVLKAETTPEESNDAVTLDVTVAVPAVAGINTSTHKAEVKVYKANVTAELNGDSKHNTALTELTKDTDYTVGDDGTVTITVDKNGDYIVDSQAVALEPTTIPTPEPTTPEPVNAASLQNDAAAIKEEELVTEPEPAPQNGEGGVDEAPAQEASAGE